MHAWSKPWRLQSSENITCIKLLPLISPGIDAVELLKHVLEKSVQNVKQLRHFIFSGVEI